MREIPALGQDLQHLVLQRLVAVLEKLVIAGVAQHLLVAAVPQIALARTDQLEDIGLVALLELRFLTYAGCLLAAAQTGG